MPMTKQVSGPDLGIQVDDIGRPFYPGSVITGHVTRRSPAISPMATVEICLRGRAKVKLAVTRQSGAYSSSTSYYRGRFNFFDDSIRSRNFSGPLHIPPEQSRERSVFPFSIQVPEHPSPAALLSEHTQAKSCYLSLAPDDIASACLPYVHIFPCRGAPNVVLDNNLDGTSPRYKPHNVLILLFQGLLLRYGS